MNSQYKETKEKIALEIKEALTYSEIAICLDLWQDKLRKIHYLGATCHYLKRDETTNDMSLQSRVLELITLDADLPKEANRLYDVVIEILQTYDIYDQTDHITFVTDRGANIVNTVDGYKHINCFNHFLNNISKAALKPIEGLKKDVNRLVKYMKCSGKNVALSSSLNSFVKTRWNSFYNTLDSLLHVLPEIEPLINRRRTDMKRLYKSLNAREMTAVCNFIEIFHTLTKELETDKSVTAGKILPVQEMMLKHIQNASNDHPTVSKMKKAAQDYIEVNDVLPNNAIIWTFFDPRFKRLENFQYTGKNQEDAIRKLRVQIEVEEMITDETDHENQMTSSAETETETKTSVFDGLEEKETSSHKNRLSLAEEIDFFIRMPYQKGPTVLEFWQKNANQLPRMYKYFLSFAAIPATSSSVERMFSISSNVLTNKRSRLDPNLLNILTFLNKNTQENK